MIGWPVSARAKAATPAGTDGAVVLMHDGGGDRAQTVAAVDRLPGSLDAQGYRFVTVSEGLRLPANAAMRRAEGATRLRGQALLTAYMISRGLTWALFMLLIPLTALTLGRTMIVVMIARRHRRNARQRGDFPAVCLGVWAVRVDAHAADGVRERLGRGGVCGVRGGSGRRSRLDGGFGRCRGRRGVGWWWGEVA